MYDFSGRTVAITGRSRHSGQRNRRRAGRLRRAGGYSRRESRRRARLPSSGWVNMASRFRSFQCDVLNRDSVAQAAQDVVSLGKLDCLVNGAGGNKPQATTGAS
jgi:NAD(P)-dependent dehydrogenase (short-subunit alcohol dehydrogenase family)